MKTWTIRNSDDANRFLGRAEARSLEEPEREEEDCESQDDETDEEVDA